MSNFYPPRPGDLMHYMCTKCHHRFVQKIPEPFLFIRRKVKCPECGGRAEKDPAIMY